MLCITVTYIVYVSIKIMFRYFGRKYDKHCKLILPKVKGRSVFMSMSEATIFFTCNY